MATRVCSACPGGGFSALQVAARQPPSLKAIIPVHGTDDRFADDIHYKGGCLLTAGLSWGTLYTLYMMRPPDPQLSGEHWRQIWTDRFEHCPFVLKEWMAHQYKNDYWKHGSVAEDYSQVKCPALIICGWTDGYTNAAMRMAEHLPDDCQVMIGPWAHTYPHLARPGPRSGFLQQAVQWWDHWLKDIDNDVDQQPRIKLWLQNSVEPASEYEWRDGNWLGFDAWPPHQIIKETRYFRPKSLSNSPSAEVIMSIQSPLANAILGPEWLPHGVGPELSVDQTSEDAGSLCFDTELLQEEMVLCGAVKLKLKLKASGSSGIVLVRLVDLFSDGKSTQISYGLLNLEHRNGLHKPEPVVPDEWMDVEIQLNDIAQCLPAGHRLRLAISTQAWPLVWPAKHNNSLALNLAQCRLNLPTLKPGTVESQKIEPLQPPAIPEPLAITWLRPVNRQRTIKRDPLRETVSRTYLKDDGAFRIEEHGLEIDASGCLTYHCRGEDPLSAEAEYEYRIQHSRGEWNAAVKCRVKITSDMTNFYIDGEYRMLEDGQRVKTRNINEIIPRLTDQD